MKDVLTLDGIVFDAETLMCLRHDLISQRDAALYNGDTPLAVTLTHTIAVVGHYINAVKPPTMNKNNFSDPVILSQVAEFHMMFDHVIHQHPTIPDEATRNLRVNLIEEEFRELREAIEEGNLVNVADALADLQYVLSGTILSFGLGQLFPAIFNEVQRSNMSKACDTEGEAHMTIAERSENCYYIERNGKFCVRRKEDDKTIKSINYSPANIKLILFKYQLQPGQIYLEYETDAHKPILLSALIITSVSLVVEDFKVTCVVRGIDSITYEVCQRDPQVLCDYFILLPNIDQMEHGEEKAKVLALHREYERWLQGQHTGPVSNGVVTDLNAKEGRVTPAKNTPPPVGD